LLWSVTVNANKFTTMDRRSFVLTGAAALAGGIFPPRLRPSIQSARPRPSAEQLAWQKDERAMFLHFGMNTFTDREWGDGRESPSLFAPSSLDAREWARVARAAGFRAMILTAKHHDGFCLWPSRTTKHTVAASPWRGGGGDLVREFVDACRAEGLRAGLYLSPWDRNCPLYGDSPRYNDFYCDQLTELLTGYGTISEVWFDGANGEGPNGKSQAYDWPRFFALVRRLQPEAVMFSDAGPDVRWCGNETGSAGEPNWSTVDPTVVPFPGASGPLVTQSLQHGDAAGTAWRPAEADTSIRPGWFHHPAEDQRVRTTDALMELYMRTVGRNAKLLLNVPPTQTGHLHPTDVARLTAFGKAVSALFANDLAAGARHAWRTTGEHTAEDDVELGRPVTVTTIGLGENIANGQAVARFTLLGSDGGNWHQLTRGMTIGYARVDRVPPTLLRRLRLIVEDAVAPPEQVAIHLYGGGS
jgi:alpha-L-fucosidase